MVVKGKSETREGWSQGQIMKASTAVQRIVSEGKTLNILDRKVTESDFV